MTKNNFLIYGSYGYSGNLIAELACKQGLKPVLAGRNKVKLEEQAKRLELDYKVFSTENLDDIKQAISEFIAVIHCAGPFIKTYKNMAQACIETQTHYLDITGEYQVIENLIKMNEQALAANVMLLPGTGFDVVPSDCLAQHLKSKLPNATQLILAIHGTQKSSASDSSISRGTARTIVENLAEGSLIRDKGVLTQIPLAGKKRVFNFGIDKDISCATVSWGDLASAWWSTRIPHIETYMSIHPKMIKMYKWINPIKFIFKWNLVKNYLLNRINTMPEGPNLTTLKNSTTHIYGEAINADGLKVAALIHAPNGYELTALSSIHIIKKILSGNAPKGFQTPSTAYSKDLILEIPGTKRVDC